MDLGLSEEQQMIQTSAREFLAEKSSKEVVRAMEEDDLGYPPELWKEMAGQGWMGMVFPEQYGGDGFSFLDLAVLIEEMGRNLTPSPFFNTVVLCGMPILEFGTDAQKEAHLGKIAAGLVLQVDRGDDEAQISARFLAVMPVIFVGLVLMANPDIYGEAARDPLFWPIVLGAGALQVLGIVIMGRMARVRI